MNYFPLTLPLYLGLGAIIVFLVVLVELNILAYTFEKMGIHPHLVFGLLLLCLLGSSINIPIARLPERHVVSDQIVSYFGVEYVVPVATHWPATIIAVNLGGAIIPTLLSLYLLVRHQLLVPGIIGIAILAAITHLLARPVPGVGIALPTLIPPIAAAIVAPLLSWRSAAPLAYISGSLGTLIGADLLNLGSIQGLGAPIASIGGAGTFDGIFLAGVLAVLLTASPLPAEEDSQRLRP